MELFCTAGRGTEVFVVKELHASFRQCLETVEAIDGKVFFQVQEDCKDIEDRVGQLMTVERLFVHVLTRKLTPQCTSRRELLTLLHTELNNKCLWDTAIKTLHRIVDKNASNPIYIGRYPSTILSFDMKDKHTQVFDADKLKTSRSMRELGTMTKTEVLKDPVINTINTKKRCNEDSKDIEVSPVKRLCTRQPVCQMNKETVSFRVSCKFTGSVRHKLKTQMSSKQMGVLLSKLMGWKIDLRHPDIEICIHMNDEAMIVGIPVFQKPLARRDYIKHDGLRSTVCRIMAQLANIQTGDVVLDPMCGKAVLLLEALHLCKAASYIGVDISSNQLTLARENIEYRPEQISIQILQGNCLDLPLHDSCMDKIITDAPFGQNHKIQTDTDKFYIEMLHEAYRVMKVNAAMVLLTSTEVADRLYQDLPHGDKLDTNINPPASRLKLSSNITDDDIQHLLDKSPDSVKQSDSEKISEPKTGLEDISTCDSLENELVKTSVSEQNMLQQSLSDMCQEEMGNDTEIHIQHVLEIASDNKSDKTDMSGELRFKSADMGSTENVLSCSNISKSDSIVKSKDTKLDNNPSIFCMLKDKFILDTCHYVKLGDTDAFICVLHIHNKKSLATKCKYL